MCRGYKLNMVKYVTAFVIQWLEFLATDPEVRVRFPALPDFLRTLYSRRVKHYLLQNRVKYFYSRTELRAFTPN
jgi:hypothetical protein